MGLLCNRLVRARRLPGGTGGAGGARGRGGAAPGGGRRAPGCGAPGGRGVRLRASAWPGSGFCGAAPGVGSGGSVRAGVPPPCPVPPRPPGVSVPRHVPPHFPACPPPAVSSISPRVPCPRMSSSCSPGGRERNGRQQKFAFFNYPGFAILTFEHFIPSCPAVSPPGSFRKIFFFPLNSSGS